MNFTEYLKQFLGKRNNKYKDMLSIPNQLSELIEEAKIESLLVSQQV